MLAINQEKKQLQAAIVAHHAAFFASCIGCDSRLQKIAARVALLRFFKQYSAANSIYQGFAVARRLQGGVK